MIGQHRNHGARMREFTWRGHRCVSLENAQLRAVFVLDKGCDLVELTHKPSDTETLHQAPAGLAPLGTLPSSALAVGNFRDQFPGGWYVMLPNGPGPCEHRGASYGQHGEATFLPWDYAVERDDPGGVAIRAWTRLRRTPLVIERRIALDWAGATLVIDESVTSEAAHPLEVLWGHHPTFGAPLIEAGSAVDLPPCTMVTANVPPPAATLRPGTRSAWPELGGEDLSVIPGDRRNAQDFLHCEEMASGWFAVRNPRRGAGVAVRWDETLFPLLGYWRLLGGGNDYPWYGARTMLALEPCCDLPSVADAAARGTAIVLASGERRETRIEATLFAAGERAVRDVAWGGMLNLEDADAA
ncbi:MAG TPA: DUF4432 family protein [Sphingomonas sp.]|nr:DUF4432 family protein [Sphingomonas sp.]